MRRFETDLGVKCGHCHVEDPNTHKFDYASDDNPAKNTTRLMITMLKDINEKYLPLLGADKPLRLSCDLRQLPPGTEQPRRPSTR